MRDAEAGCGWGEAPGSEAYTLAYRKAAANSRQQAAANWATDPRAAVPNASWMMVVYEGARVVL